MSTAGERVELTRYRLPGGERVLYGQRIDGAVTVADVPAGDHGRVYLVERRVRARPTSTASSPPTGRQPAPRPARRPPPRRRHARRAPELARAAPPGGVTRTGASAPATPGSDPTSTHQPQGDDSR
jgi:hypothetical protein